MGFWEKAKKVLIGEPPPKPQKNIVVETPETTPEPKTSAPVGSGEYKRVKVERGARGWGGPLIVEPKPGKHLIYSVTGGGIHPVAQRIADLTGGTAFDGFKSKANFEEIAVAVIDCGGTARVGVYPMKGVLTIDIHTTSPSGPLMKYIKETNFVSGVTVDNITLLDN
jgi:sorbitol-specific phosphotransferase system component IIBC